MRTTEELLGLYKDRITELDTALAHSLFFWARAPQKSFDMVALARSPRGMATASVVGPAAAERRPALRQAGADGRGASFPRSFPLSSLHASSPPGP